MVGKGIGKGIVSRDGKTILGGFGDGATSVGKGFTAGIKSAVGGATDGASSAFHGKTKKGKGFRSDSNKE